MFKLIAFFFGLAMGAAAAIGWLLSEPESPQTTRVTPGDRVSEARERFSTALQEGNRIKAETEVRLRTQLDSYRRTGGPSGAA